MICTVAEINNIGGDEKKHAGGKAREDLLEVFSECGFKKLYFKSAKTGRDRKSPLYKLVEHIRLGKEWEKTVSNLRKGDTLVLQFPVLNHTLFLNKSIQKAKKNGVRIGAFIHDLEFLRMSNSKKQSFFSRLRMKKEELDELREFDFIVAHNIIMKDYLVNKLGLDRNRIVVLDLFDYLTPKSFVPSSFANKQNSCIIAGNLKKEKAEYVYNLPEAPDFELYGVNYEGGCRDNVHYHGSFLPDDLLLNIRGGFGLVWDGESIDTCSGAWGEYLKYNNPHKASLYLACGIPIVIWEKAALAEYVSKNGVGLTIKSINDLDETIKSVSLEQYHGFKSNALKISKGIRNGSHTIKALKDIGLI